MTTRGDVMIPAHVLEPTWNLPRTVFQLPVSFSMAKQRHVARFWTESWITKRQLQHVTFMFPAALGI